MKRIDHDRHGSYFSFSNAKRSGHGINEEIFAQPLALIPLVDGKTP